MYSTKFANNYLKNKNIYGLAASSVHLIICKHVCYGAALTLRVMSEKSLVSMTFSSSSTVIEASYRACAEQNRTEHRRDEKSRYEGE